MHCRVRLKGWRGYGGGLDVSNDMTGTHSYFKSFEEHQVMFHVSTLLPFFPEDAQQVRNVSKTIFECFAFIYSSYVQSDLSVQILFGRV